MVLYLTFIKKFKKKKSKKKILTNQKKKKKDKTYLTNKDGTIFD